MSSKALSPFSLRKSVFQVLFRPANKMPFRSFHVLPVTQRAVVTKLHFPNLQTCRYKSKKGKSKVEDDESSDDEKKEDEEQVQDDDAEDIPGVKVLNFKTVNLRIDRVLKATIANKQDVETAFLGGNIRRNEEKVLKKALEVGQGDTLDIVHGICDTNPNMLRVSRLEILDVQNHGRVVHFRARVSRDLLIKHYDS